MIEAEKQCGFKDRQGVQCANLIKSRGLCDTHLYQALRGKDPVKKQWAEKFLKEAKLKTAPRPRNGAPVSLADVEASVKQSAPKKRAARFHDVDQPGGKTAAAQAKATQAKQVKGRLRAAKQEVRDMIVDARISTATELASWMGLARVPALGGFLLIDEQNDRKLLVDKDGDLREVSLTIGNALQGEAAEPEEEGK